MTTLSRCLCVMLLGSAAALFGGCGADAGDSDRLTNGRRHAARAGAENSSDAKTLESAPLASASDRHATTTVPLVPPPPPPPKAPGPVDSPECVACMTECAAEEMACKTDGEQTDELCDARFGECISECLATPACTGTPNRDGEPPASSDAKR